MLILPLPVEGIQKLIAERSVASHTMPNVETTAALIPLCAPVGPEAPAAY